MSIESSGERDDVRPRSRQHATERGRELSLRPSEPTTNHDRHHYSPSLLSPSLLSHEGLAARRNAPARAALMRSAQQTHGNRALQRMVQAGSARLPLRGDEIARRIEGSAGVGDKLDPKARERLEESLQADLSNVRIHTGPDADHLARSVGATAFTTGRDIFFSAGAYDAHSTEGLKLLAHEATHTLQQSAGPVDGTPTDWGVSISDPSDRFEREAERAADSASSGRYTLRSDGPDPVILARNTRASTGSGAGLAVQRAPANPPPEWWDQAYDDPTPEEWAKLEKMYQEGLKEGPGEGPGEAPVEGPGGPGVGTGAGGGGLLGMLGLSSFMPLLAGLGAGAAVMTYSSDSIVGQDEEMAMLQQSRQQQAAREAAQANTPTGDQGTTPSPAEEEDEGF